MDQLLALRGVRENIAAFGCDLKKVMLFGQSAGAQHTFFIATRPDAPSLIKAAAMESGAGRDYPTIDKVQFWQKSFMDGLNCTDLACARNERLGPFVGSNIEDASLFIFGAAAPLINQTYSVSNFSSLVAPVFAAMVDVYTAFAFTCPTYRALLGSV
ncbi:Alpha/Beta hydrolase protein, partial [Colletotrichum navitas]